ncbi:MAG: hypothetical protein IT243_01040 [Bacteroidia bacterium]|nr:hypothetical protein [Bacteroidia bacterium]
MNNISLHTFHIPVMGLAFTVDSPVKVAHLGISSVVSIIEDKLLEMMRNYYYNQINEKYIPITDKEEDYRAKRVTDYLNLINKIVHQKFDKLKNSAFEKGSEIVKYLEMLPENNQLKDWYNNMLHSINIGDKLNFENLIRNYLKPGNIDVNIMTKTDREKYDKEGNPIPGASDAVAALRGYVNSNLTNSSIVFSAGMNPRLFNYLDQCPQFNIKPDGTFEKKIIIKVSDYRSALIQGKYLAKKGIWVSEFRMESGLNCGGHAFATDGYLMGPILDEFKTNKNELINTLFEIYKPAAEAKTSIQINQIPELKITAQGGIGTASEDEFLRSNYELDGTGWGTPFLLVPEATTVDNDTMELLCKAKKDDIELSNNSPLGIGFHYLKGTGSHKEKLQRIENNKPGSPCPEKHLEFNTEFTKLPICTASHKYQKLKLQALKEQNLKPEILKQEICNVLDKECLCVGLSNAASKRYKIDFVKKQETVTICPGPNIVYFNKVVSLQTMTDHIYGRKNILDYERRKHMFINELELYIDFLKNKINKEKFEAEKNPKLKKYYSSFYLNLISGIEYYRNLKILKDSKDFIDDLRTCENKLEELNSEYNLVETVNCIS